MHTFKQKKYDPIRIQLLEAIQALKDRAEELRTDFWLYRKENNNDLDWNERSRLSITIEETKGAAFNLTWRVFLRAKPDARGKAITKRIPKGRTNSYSRRSLAAHAKAWEMDTVVSYEEKAAKIRTEMKCLVAALDYLRRAEQAAPEED